ncbi:hypothetical protein [Demequina globuliformis]|uniref:hypothetical protein n=1 Tax=Demequina globuliformis TaxID=676202 RepID=UPI000783C4F7|nr:hypothetical protein [Demequina globuliformis]
MTAAEVLSIAGYAIVLALAVRLFLVAAIAGLRLTDVIGYIVAAAWVVVLGGLAWELGTGPGVVAIATAAFGGTLWALHTRRRRARDPEAVFLGVFLVGKVPAGVRNWIGFEDDAPFFRRRAHQ